MALDQKLGCLEDEHTVDSDTQNLIDAINIFFANVPELELKIPFWKLFSTPTWRKYIKALDTITKWELDFILKSIFLIIVHIYVLKIVVHDVLPENRTISLCR